MKGVFVDVLSLSGYIFGMKYEIERTEQFDAWFAGLKDRVAKIRIAKRLDAMIDGHFGDHKMIADNLFECACFTVQGIAPISLSGAGRLFCSCLEATKKARWMTSGRRKHC